MVSQLSRLNDATPSSPKRRFPHLVEGLVQVCTCPHRRFFANIMAQALQIAGQGTSVLIVQFLKGGINQGPEHPTQLGQHLTWLRCDVLRCIDGPELEPHELESLLELWRHVQAVVNQGKYSVVILDELSLAISMELIPLDEVMHFLQHRPRHVDVTLSGPEMPPAIIEMADQVTELRRSYT